MLIPRVARRYAEAVYQAVPADFGMDSFLADLHDIRLALDRSRELRNFFASPVVPHAKKHNVIEEIFARSVHAYTYGVILFLLKKRREHLLGPIIEAVFDLYREHQGIRKAAVRSARPLTTEQQHALSETLAGLTQHRIESSFELDERLIGGVIVRVDDKVYDGSVARQLQRLRQRFISGTEA